jgi:hypothetical protein
VVGVNPPQILSVIFVLGFSFLQTCVPMMLMPDGTETYMMR